MNLLSCQPFEKRPKQGATEPQAGGVRARSASGEALKQAVGFILHLVDSQGHRLNPSHKSGLERLQKQRNEHTSEALMCSLGLMHKDNLRVNYIALEVDVHPVDLP